jgi:hypothetical protein
MEEYGAMRKGLIMSLIGALSLTLLACEKGKSKASDDEGEAAAVETEADTSSADQKPEDQGPVTCSSLNIPTYDLLIKDLSALRCDNCHNETFAWQGIVLTQYEPWKTYVKPIRNRIFYNLLSQPLEEGEQAIFLSWIDNGLPKTEADCANLKK